MKADVAWTKSNMIAIPLPVSEAELRIAAGVPSFGAKVGDYCARSRLELSYVDGASANHVVQSSGNSCELFAFGAALNSGGLRGRTFVPKIAFLLSGTYDISGLFLEEKWHHFVHLGCSEAAIRRGFAVRFIARAHGAPDGVEAGDVLLAELPKIGSQTQR